MNDPQLARLSDEFFQTVHAIDPFTATQLGVSGFDAQIPDPSRNGSAAGIQHIASIEHRLTAIDARQLGEPDQVNHAVLTSLAWGARSDLEYSLWESNASPGAYVCPQAIAFQSVPTALLADAGVSGLPAYRRFLDAEVCGYVEGGAGTASGWPTRWACTPPTCGGWACSRSTPCGPAGSSATAPSRSASWTSS
jgi:hypothetical protein